MTTHNAPDKNTAHHITKNKRRTMILRRSQITKAKLSLSTTKQQSSVELWSLWRNAATAATTLLVLFKSKGNSFSNSGEESGGRLEPHTTNAVPSTATHGCERHTTTNLLKD
ncbi:unnamed protein product [Ceratitis capitata]|uniref:(Mediterranean fruit fly) hypothetical protein n=1 Tax=Ceratitis capitata TaxID=7213 RepID=A0A811VIA0_CERCA|nr:unnamed protein product [Ceratitis capitata]